MDKELQQNLSFSGENTSYFVFLGFERYIYWRFYSLTSESYTTENINWQYDLNINANIR